MGRRPSFTAILKITNVKCKECEKQEKRQQEKRQQKKIAKAIKLYLEKHPELKTQLETINIINVN